MNCPTKGELFYRTADTIIEIRGLEIIKSRLNRIKSAVEPYFFAISEFYRTAIEKNPLFGTIRPRIPITTRGAAHMGIRTGCKIENRHLYHQSSKSADFI